MTPPEPPHPPLPPGFAARMRDLLGPAEADALLAALALPPSAGLRVSPLEADAVAWAADAPFGLEPLPWTRDGFRITGPEGARPGLHPHHAAGVYYLQDPSAMAVGEAARWALRGTRAPRVIDLAAAPGGKSTHVAGVLESDPALAGGVLIANDVVGARALELSRNLERWGARGALVTSAAVADLADAWGAAFDLAILDAPCSGEGMFRKSPEARAAWNEAGVQGCAARQGALLDDAARLVAPGGALVYSTCTFAPEEDEAAVAAFLARAPEFGLEPLVPDALPGATPGRPEWGGGVGALAGTARFWPHLAPGEGHFVALLRRAPDARGETGRAARGDALPPAPRALREAWRAFAGEELPSAGIADARIAVHKGTLLAVPDAAPPLAGVRLVRAGLPLGAAPRGRFEPAHALARALRPEERSRRASLPADAPEIAAWLRGLEIDAPGPDGWLTIEVDGHALGWGRRVQGVVRNRYPKGLRVR